MTDGPGQQPPQEPRRNAADGEREVLEGRVIPSRGHSQRDADPRQQFRRQSPPPQAPEPGPAWSPQADAAAQAASQAQPQGGQPWSSAPDQPAALDPTGRPEPATQIIPAQNWSPPQQAAPPAQQQAPGPQQPYAGQQAPAQPQAYGGEQAPPQQQPQPQAHSGQAPAQQQPQPQSYGGRQAPAQPQGPAPQQQAPAAQGGGAGHVPFAGGPAPRPTPPARTQPQAEPRHAGGGGAAESGTPDWTALAERQEATGARRRRVLMLAGGIVAVAVIAGVVATAVVMSGKSDGKPSAGPSSATSSTASQQPLPPAPSFSSVAPPPPVDPRDYLNTAAKDKAPLTPESLFPGKQFVWKGRTYVKTATDVTASCAKNARQAVATALSANGCQKLIRATYTQGGLAVTVGVAVFADDTHAKKVQGVSQYLAPLNGGGVADFCRAVRCQMTANSVGRYAYFAIAGFKNGTTLAANDTVGKQAANDASDFAFSRIVQRGKDAAAADPTRK
ncbi:hypothetical protein [Streptomyces sp. NBC_01477]|uniref:hypothetical protein n=1 Tax=Streptomyces sp. NBC_01477 TaxID=2976015 RepID=UPI002E318953|nr:hypothetical protein [Streptomyces sp. NBC_01477]